jgi:2-oxoisovalerate ferredoxin oxidoreductase beta subunit
MTNKVKYSKPDGFFDTFERRPGSIKKNMHYCPGCGHGILHKLIAEAISDLDMKDNTILISPVGCSVFAYYYFDCGGISVPHGRACSVATGLSRANEKNCVISYQGDGDLGAIGFNNYIQAANRGENISVFFINNAIYGMTGGQMAPTSLPGQKTLTSPQGRSVLNEGFPMQIAEMTATLEAPVYVERVALSTYSNILKARKAVRKALKYNIDKKGFSMVEFLAGCPINMKFNAREMNDFIDSTMTKYFPLGCLKDVADSRDPIKRPKGKYNADKVKTVLYQPKLQDSVTADFRNESPIFEKERRIKIAGFGGQGVLSLGLMIATMGKLRNFNVSWLPSYGPEMRGGTANCSVVTSRNVVGSPVIEKDCNLLIAMNQPSLDKFLPELIENGVLIYDSSTVSPPEESCPRYFGIKASDIAVSIGNVKCANSVILGALAAIMRTLFLEGEDKKDFDRVFEEAIIDRFEDKSDVVKMNINAFYAGKVELLKEIRKRNKENNAG